MDEDTSRMSTWKTVDDELHRRRLKWAGLAEALGTNSQVVQNWKLRGKIPADRYLAVAAYLGWTVERLLGYAPEPAAPPVPAAEVKTKPVYSKRGNDIATEFEKLTDPKVRQTAYAAVMSILQMAQAGQRLAEPLAAGTAAATTSASAPKSRPHAPAPTSAPVRGR